MSRNLETKPVRLLPLLAVTVLALAAGPRSTVAEVVHQPVYGDIVITSPDFECPVGPCRFCINDVDDPGDHRLMLAFGVTQPGQAAWGPVDGTVAPFVVIDGVTVAPSLLPEGSYFLSGLQWRDFPFPPNCNGSPPFLTYRIGAVPESTVAGDGVVPIVIPAEGADVIPFEFDFCSQFTFWGAGCDVGGSSPNSWKLHLPAPVQPYSVPAGDAPPFEDLDAGAAIDFADSPGGTLTLTRVEEGAARGNTPPGPAGHWELRTDMPDGTYVADVSFAFKASELPEGIEPGSLLVARLDPEGWEYLTSTVDVVGGIVTTTTDAFGIFVLTWDTPLPIEAESWGTIKARYGGTSR